MYVGAFLRQTPPEAQDPGAARDQAAAPADVHQLYEVGTLAKVENMVKHESIQGAQLLLYGHTRIKRLDMVRSWHVQAHLRVRNTCTSCTKWGPGQGGEHGGA